jgi:hypothetical protein
VGGGLGIFGDGVVAGAGLVVGLFLVVGERDVGRRLEELFPELGPLPHIFGMDRILFYYGQDAGCHNAMGSAEVVVDFWTWVSTHIINRSMLLGELVYLEA